MVALMSAVKGDEVLNEDGTKVCHFKQDVREKQYHCSSAYICNKRFFHRLNINFIVPVYRSAIHFYYLI